MHKQPRHQYKGKVMQGNQFLLRFINFYQFLLNSNFRYVKLSSRGKGKQTSLIFFIFGMLRERNGYNQFHNILRLSDLLPIIPFTTSETVCDYYL